VERPVSVAGDEIGSAKTLLPARIAGDPSDDIKAADIKSFMIVLPYTAINVSKRVKFPHP
jgi:hypothetical protein